MTKPSFLIIGAAKSATTNLHALLCAHPHVFAPEQKELWYFARDHLYQRGMSWYLDFFKETAPDQITGESSTGYSMHGRHPHASERIAQDLPDARLIYIVRHPLDRLESSWKTDTYLGITEKLTFATAIRDDADRWADPGLYWKQINLYRRFFPDERILVLFFDEYKRDPVTHIQRCYEFLGIDAGFAPDNRKRNQNASSRYRSLPGWFQKAVRNPLFLGVYRAMPYGSQRHARKALLKFFNQSRRFIGRNVEAPVWTDESRKWAANYYREDAAAFLEFYGKPRDYWDLDAPVAAPRHG